ncbi:MAG: HU family DNA-binding protein [Bacillota bacterium]
MKLRKKELVEKLTKKTGLTKKDTKNLLDAFTDVVGEELNNGNEIALTGFGKFYPRHRKARKATNPQDPKGDKIDVPAKDVPKFKAGATLKKVTNGDV